ncbi:hypothetical protein HY385_01370 [Candidatus Daviesbacteria bacterium]|nr:hypothetical protein [Candidatus Daviesbacteria bacterium]
MAQVNPEQFEPKEPDKGKAPSSTLKIVGPTQEEMDAANRGDYAPRGLTKLLVNLSKSWLIRLGLVGGGAVITYVKVPAVHQFINSIPEYLQNYRHSSEVAKGVINPADAVYMTPEEYRKEGPPTIKHDDVNIPPPIKLPPGKENTPINFITRHGGFERLVNPRLNPDNPNEQLNDERIPVNDEIILDNIPIGGILISPIDGVITNFNHPAWVEQPDGTLSITGFFIEGKDEQGNEVSLAISTVGMKPIIDSPRTVLDEKGNVVPHAPIPVRIGQPIGAIVSQDHHQFFPGQVRISATSITTEGGVKEAGPANLKISVTQQRQTIMLR